MSGETNKSLDQLYNLKLQKLKEQKRLSDEMNDILSKDGGLNESVRLSVKNLHAAIAVSRKPGYFEFYQPPDDIKQTEDKKVLNNYARLIQRVHKELEQIDEEIQAATAQLHSSSQRELPRVSSLSEWFDMYGRPKLTEEKVEMMTKFDHNTKIYGGTHHYSSFKTSSTIMRKGRLTR
eukprot:gene8080-10947_t